MTSFEQQYAAAQNECVVFDQGDRTQIELIGEDRASFLQNFCTNNVAALSPGQGCEAFLCNVQGKIIAFIFVFCGEDSLQLDSTSGQAESIMAHLDRYIIREDVELIDHTPGDRWTESTWGEVVIRGPRASECLRKALGVEPPTAMLEHRQASPEFVVRRTPLLGDDCWQVRGIVARLFHLLGDAGAIEGDKNLFAALRIEAGFPEYGVDIDDRNLPQEVNRDESAIDFTKGCYLGQETVARIDALGHVNRMLTGVEISGDAPPVGSAFFADDKEVGYLTSIAASGRKPGHLALGYVRCTHREPGTKLTCESSEATVRSLPFVEKAD